MRYFVPAAAMSAVLLLTPFDPLPRDTPCMQSVHDRARRFETHRTRPCSQIDVPPPPCTARQTPPHSLHVERTDDRARRFETRRTPCTESVHDRAGRLQTVALLACIALTTVLAEMHPPCTNRRAHDRARRLETHRNPCTRAYTTVLADLTSSTALLALMALTTVWTSAAHLALRPILHPVLAWPLCGRAPLPLRPLAQRDQRHPHLDVHIRERSTLCRATLLACRANTTVLADLRPTALLALRALTTVLAD